MPAARMISQTVDGATVAPSFVISPWIRRYPHSGFGYVHLRVISWRCQASSVPGVTSRWARSPAGSSRASAARMARSRPSPAWAG